MSLQLPQAWGPRKSRSSPLPACVDQIAGASVPPVQIFHIRVSCIVLMPIAVTLPAALGPVALHLCCKPLRGIDRTVLSVQ